MLMDSLVGNLEGNILYFELHVNLNYQETINLQGDYEATIRQEQLNLQAVRQ